MKISVTIEREFEMDEQRVLAEPRFAPPSADATDEEKQRWLTESFYELCGVDRDEDHVNGTYVGQLVETVYVDFHWPASLAVSSPKANQ